MRTFLKAGVFALVAVCVVGGVVFAAEYTGELFSEVGGISIGPDGSGSAYANLIKFQQTGSQLYFTGDGSVSAGNDLVLGGDGDAALGATDSVQVSAGENISLSASDSINMSGGANLDLSAPDSISLYGGDIDISGDAVDIDAPSGNLQLSSSGTRDSIFRNNGILLDATEVSEDWANMGALFSEHSILYGVNDGIEMAAVKLSFSPYSIEIPSHFLVDYESGLIGETAKLTLRLGAFDDEDTDAPISEMFLYEEVEGEGETNDNPDARLIAYTGDSCLQAMDYNTQTQATSLTAEVRVENDGDVVIRLGS